MLKNILFLILTLTAVTVYSLDCPGGFVCIHDNDGSELCTQASPSGVACPAGSHPQQAESVLPICNPGNVKCMHLNDFTVACIPGYLCPAGTLQLGESTLPECPNNQQMCVYGAMYGCFEYMCPPGMTPVGSIRCDIPPTTSCTADQKICLWDIGNGLACQQKSLNCWPGTHEWKPCGPTLDFVNNQITLPNGHFIKCFSGLTKAPNGQVRCLHPFFDTLTVPDSYWTSKLLYIYFCDGSDNSFQWMLPIAQQLGFSSVFGHYAGVYPFTSASWQSEFFGNSGGSVFPEFCYKDGNLIGWQDCDPILNFNGNCIATEFFLNP